MDSLKEGMENWEKDPRHAVFSTKNDTEVLPRAFQFVINILLYITSADCDVIHHNASLYRDMVKRLDGLKSKAKKQKLQKRIDRESGISRYIVGSSFQLSREEKMLYDTIKSSGKHKLRYPVGGHWRKQWYGHKDAQYQKPKWIRPHFRGPELAELIKSIGLLK